MYRFWLLLLLAVAVSCAGKAASKPGPADVAEDFYYWYLGYPGNPLVEAAYRDSGSLSAAYIQRVDEMLAQGLRYDPLLCAQSLPESFQVQPVEGADDVTIRLTWNMGTPYEQVVVLRLDMVQLDGTWFIDGVTCPEEP